MNIETIDSLFKASKCCFYSMKEDILPSLSILKSLWQDKKISSAINKAKMTLDKSLEAGCMGACRKCRNTALEIFKCLGNVGLEQIFLNLIIERQHLKKTVQIYPSSKK